MNKKTIILLVVLTVLNSCVKTNRYNLVKKVEVDFSKNTNEFLFIQEYMMSNCDSVIGISISRKDEISFSTIYSVKETVLPIKINDEENFYKYLSDTSGFYKVVEIMKSKDFISVSKNKEGVTIASNSMLPCYIIVYSKQNIDSITWIQDLIDNYQVKTEVHWVYKLNDNWYIRGVPCFD